MLAWTALFGGDSKCLYSFRLHNLLEASTHKSIGIDFCACNLHLWPFDPKINGFQDSLWTISVSRLVILALSVFEMSCGKTNKQTYRHKCRSSTVGVIIKRELTGASLAEKLTKKWTLAVGTLMCTGRTGIMKIAPPKQMSELIPNANHFKS